MEADQTPFANTPVSWCNLAVWGGPTGSCTRPGQGVSGPEEGAARFAALSRAMR